MVSATAGWEQIDQTTHPGRGWWAQRRVMPDGRVLWFDIGSNVLQFCYSDGVYIGSRKNILEARALCERGKREPYVMDDPRMSTAEEWKLAKRKFTLKWAKVNKADHHAEVPEGEKQPPRIRELDEKTFAVYRDSRYLGSEATLGEAKIRAELNTRSDRNRVMRLWEQTNPGELPPYLMLTDGEREEYWRRNPPKRREPPASVRPPKERGDAKPPKLARVEKPSDLDGSAVLTIVNTANPKQAGSSAHGRWSLLLGGGHATVADFLQAGGNPETLKNAVAKGYAKLGE